MSNAIGAQFINSLRASLSGTTLFSQTSTNKPLMVDPTDIPGVARAWVSFYGFQTPNSRLCDIINKSTNVKAVSTTPGSNVRGDYTVEFLPGTFSNSSYIITGTVESDSLIPISAANTFFIKGSGANGSSQKIDKVRIQTINTTLTSEGQAAFARRINLIFYK